MKSSIITALLLLVWTFSFGQKKLENKLTPEHQNVSGTKISWVPPKGFTAAENFLGLQQSETASNIMVINMVGPYSEISKALTKNNLMSKGVEVKKIKHYMLNGIPAIFVTANQSAKGTLFSKYIFAFGTAAETHLINGACPENLEKVGAKIKKSMLTAYYEADKMIDPFEVHDFTIDVSATKLQFAQSMSGGLTYSVDGKVPPLSSDRTFLIVTKSFSKVETGDKRQFSTSRLKQTPIDIDHIEYTNEITIDGIAGYEIYAKGKSKKTGETENVYQVILFSDGLYYILVGITNDETEASLNELRAAIRTFRRK